MALRQGIGWNVSHKNPQIQSDSKMDKIEEWIASVAPKGRYWATELKRDL